jgi:transcriptional regulator with PAS, ATPase and Fis domain
LPQSSHSGNSRDSVTMVPGMGRPPGEPAKPILVWVGGADTPTPPAKRRVIAFDQRLFIGRHPPTDLDEGTATWVVSDRLMSSEHAEISEVDGAWELCDLDSRNGSVVDAVSAQPRLKLRDGSMIFVGGQIAIFRLVSEVERAAIAEELSDPVGPVATCNPAFALLCSMLRKLAPTDGEILLTGETGAGKEVYANAVHRLSGRPGRFVAINCAAVPRELVESELFGYLRGAHSQANAPKAGIIEEAEGGTLFLDEIGDMAPELQTKLLRFTQDRMLTPVGGTRSKRIDVRILAATSRTSAPTSGQGGLRQDLAARLGAEPIRIPPLRERLEDLGTLVGFFLGDRVKPFDQQAFQALALHAWPGNVRELQKVLTTADALSREVPKIAPEHLPQAIAATPRRIRASPAGRAMRPPPSAVELEDVIRRFDGNMMRVARELDRKPALVYRWAKRYKINVDSFRKKET